MLTKTEALEYVEKLQTGDDSLRFRKGGSKSATRNRASQSMKGQHATVVSSGAGAKVRKNLQELAKSYKNFSGRTRGFIGKAAIALGMEQHEASNYRTFELDSGQRITLRVSNHNAITSLFDRNGENDGVSIVITNNANRGIKNNGAAHVVEFFYRKSDLEHSQNAPLAAIVTSIDKLLTTGEYVDITGLAEVSEVNALRFAVGEKNVGTTAPFSSERGSVDVHSVAAELQDKFGVEVEVVDSLDGVKNEQARKAIAAGQDIKGWYDLDTGKVCIYAPNAESEQDVMATYAHEVVAHKGMRGLLGEERYGELCERLGKALTPEQLELVEEYADKDADVLGDEYIARIAEMLIDEKGEIKEPTTWEKVKGAVREFFRDVFGLELTDADIRYLLWRSGERLRRNKADAFTRAQDVVTGEKLKADAAQSKGSPVRFAIGRKRIADLTKKELDKAYFGALDGNDMDYARQLVDEAARRAGYTDKESDYQGAGTWKAPRRPKYDTERERRDNIWNDVAVNITDMADGYNLVDETTFNDARTWGEDGSVYEALRAVQSAINRYKENPKHGKIRVYRAIPKTDWTSSEEVTLREDRMRNGDWVSPSKDYAYQHGLSRFGTGKFRIISEAVNPKDLWWDGNDIREWGFDDGNEYRYQNTRNNRKLNDIVTYDYDGNIIPLSKRFNKREYDTRFSIGEPYDVKEYPVGRAEPGLNGKTVTVVSVPRHDFKGTGKEALQAAGSWATDNLVGEYSNEETGGKGVMYVSGNAISKFLSRAAVHKSDSLGAHLAVLKRFKDVLRESADCESHPDFKKSKDGERRPENGVASKNIIHRLYGAVVIDGKTYRVKTTVKEQVATRKRIAPYTYEVTEIELLDGPMAGIVNDGSQLLSDAPSNSIPLAKLLKNARMSYAEAGKEANFLLDESQRRDEKEIEQTTVAKTVRAVASDLQSKFGVEVEVVDSLDGVQNEQARKAISAGQDIKGWYDIDTGKVCIYAPNAESEQDVMATYAHEVVAHKGMRGLLGEERYNELCERLGEALTPEQLELVEEYAGKDADVLGDEYIARIAEMLIDEKGNIKEPTTWEKVKGAVREFFRDVFGLDLTDADIRYLLWRSGERLRRSKADTMTRAQDVVTGQKLQDESMRMRQEEADYQREIREITERAKADGTFMKAPNGKPSNLDERQWAHVRTTRFKQWFGDWEKALRISKLYQAVAIKITGEEVTPSDDMKEYRKNALEYGKTLRGKYTNRDTDREVEVNRRSLREMLEHDYKTTAHLQSIAAIPQIIEQSIYIDSAENEDKTKNPHVTAYHYYVCGLKIGGVDYTVKAVIAEHTDGSRYYDHKLTQIEKGKLIDSLSRTSPARISQEASLSSASKDKRLSSILQANSSKVVDENGEPKVVYHGTRSTGFSVFDDSKGARKWKTGAPDGTSWFSDDISTAYSYSGSYEEAEYWDEEEEFSEPQYPPGIYECFLNIRMPYEEWFDGANWDGSRSDYAVIDEEGNIVMEGFDTREDAEAYAQKEGLEDYSVEESPDLWDDTNNVARRALDDKQSDGAIIYDVVDGGSFGYPGAANVYVVFESNQIKSATDNVGTYDTDNDDIRFAIGRKRKDDMRKGLLNKLTNASEEQVEQTITEIEKLGEQSKAGGDAKVEKAALHWVKQGTIILPEDGYKVLEAVKMATDKGIDVTQYDSPMRLINENTSWKKCKDMTDPDKVATLTGKRALGNTGITIYDVEDSEQGQRDNGLGDVILDRRSAKDSLSHGISRNKGAAFAAVGQIITAGMIIDMQKDWKGRNINSVTIAAPIEIGGKGFVGVVIVTRGSGTNANRFVYMRLYYNKVSKMRASRPTLKRTLTEETLQRYSKTLHLQAKIDFITIVCTML